MVQRCGKVSKLLLAESYIVYIYDFFSCSFFSSLVGRMKFRWKIFIFFPVILPHSSLNMLPLIWSTSVLLFREDKKKRSWFMMLWKRQREFKSKGTITQVSINFFAVRKEFLWILFRRLRLCVRVFFLFFVYSVHAKTTAFST